MSADYVPERGDLILIDFDPQGGREQKGRRPGVVLSPAKYNRVSSLAWICPITSKRKGYPFEVQVPEGLAIQGIALVDQVRSLDYRQRRAEFVTRLPLDCYTEMLGRARTLLSGPGRNYAHEIP